MPEQPEMWVGGNEDGSAVITCTRERCMVTARGGAKFWLDIELPAWPTPKDIDRIWHQHRIEHSS